LCVRRITAAVVAADDDEIDDELMMTAINNHVRYLATIEIF